MRRKHSPQLKAKAAVEGLKCLRTINEIASELEVHPSLVTQWKKIAAESPPELFSKPEKADKKGDEALARLAL